MSSKNSKVEIIKEDSHQLRGAIATELQAPSSHLDEAGRQILKFHGLYQQDDRDQRLAHRRQKNERTYTFMVRSRIPGGRLTAEQYLAHDDLASSPVCRDLHLTR